MPAVSLKIPLDQARPGMQLASAVLDGNGALLLSEGTVLGEAHLASLLRRGVTSVSITPPEGEEAPDTAARREAIIARLTHLFRHAGDGEASRVLYQAVLEYHMERMP